MNALLVLVVYEVQTQIQFRVFHTNTDHKKLSRKVNPLRQAIYGLELGVTWYQTRW